MLFRAHFLNFRKNFGLSHWCVIGGITGKSTGYIDFFPIKKSIKIGENYFEVRRAKKDFWKKCLVWNILHGQLIHGIRKIGFAFKISNSIQFLLEKTSIYFKKCRFWNILKRRQRWVTLSLYLWKRCDYKAREVKEKVQDGIIPTASKKKQDMEFDT